MVDPAALDAAATALAGQAEGLPGLLDAARAGNGVNVWQGPAQEALADDLVLLRARLRLAADELLAVAASLRADAARVRAERTAAALRAAEAAARSAGASGPVPGTRRAVA
ncbi:MAG TPA: hypothetical protein VFQ85_12355 [Mycobacteriales bacterium]|jgi:uncharacterized protein YukE|nr:hypothetical protein [Mycobacteriales bacterium]